MQKERPSKTARKVALNVVTLGSKGGMEEVLPPGVVDATAKLLVESGAVGRRAVRFSRSQIAVGIYLIIILRVGQFGWLSLAFFLQAGARLSRQCLDAVSVRIVKPSQLGLAFALNSSVGRAADMVAASLAGYLYAARPSLPFQVSLGFLPLVAVFIWWKLPSAEDELDPSDQEAAVASQLSSREQESR